MIIRHYDHRDKDRLITLFRLNTPEYFSPIEEAGLHTHLDTQSDTHFVAETEGHIVGTGGFLIIEDGRTAIICWDFVHPEYHGRGVGTALMDHRIGLIRQIPGVDTLFVRTSQLVYPFYARFGLEVCEVVKDYWDTGFDLYAMRCAIADVRTHR